MTILPLALLLAAVSAAAPKPPISDDPSKPSPIDPATLSPSARAAYEADPAGFARDHGEDLEAMRRWSQDPALGQSECLAAKQDPRTCMESRLNTFREVAKPEQLAVIQSYVKLLPRGVSAPLPTAGSERASSPSGTASQPASATHAPTPTPSPTPAPRQSGARFNAAPAPTQAAEAPAAGGAVDDWMNWFCAKFACART